MSFGPASGYYKRPSRGCLFQISPVTGCDVLAYSCAAARDLHPLPIGQLVASLRSCANLILRKSEKQQSGKSTGHCDTKSNCTPYVTLCGGMSVSHRAVGWPGGEAPVPPPASP